jgi:hypothetical protein
MSLEERKEHQNEKSHWICQECMREKMAVCFSSESAMRTHMREAHPLRTRKNAIKCLVCSSSTFETQSDLIEHLKKVHPKCKQCGACFSRERDLVLHLQEVHPFKRRGWNCLECGQGAESQEALHAHLREAHPKCKICFNKFSTRDELLAHLKSIHSVGEEKKEKKALRCFSAGCESTTFATREELHAHLREVHPKCKKCALSFHDPSSLQAHLKECGVTGKGKWVCSDCDETFESELKLDDHFKYMHPYCKECDIQCKTRKAYVNHLKMHEAVKQQSPFVQDEEEDDDDQVNIIL